MAAEAAAAKSGDEAPTSEAQTPTEFKPDKAELLEFYREMLLIRRFEEKAGQLYGMGLIGGFCHLYIGQEAVVVGLHAAATDKDTVITTYRDHGHMLALRHGPQGRHGRADRARHGYSRGKGGSMHMFSREKKFYGGHGIVGASVPLGTGLAFAHKYREDGGINYCYFGDGAVNQGQVYESFNMAALWKLPVIYVIENNKYGMGTSVERASATTELYKRGEVFGIPGMTGRRHERDRGAKGGRQGGRTRARRQGSVHPGDEDLPLSRPLDVRSRQVPDQGRGQQMRKEHDPIDALRTYMEAERHGRRGGVQDIDREIKDIVNEAAEFAQSSPEPDPSELWTDVLVEA